MSESMAVVRDWFMATKRAFNVMLSLQLGEEVLEPG